MTDLRTTEGRRLHAGGRTRRVDGAQCGLQQASPRAMPGETVCVGHVGEPLSLRVFLKGLDTAPGKDDRSSDLNQRHEGFRQQPIDNLHHIHGQAIQSASTLDARCAATPITARPSVSATTMIAAVVSRRRRPVARSTWFSAGSSRAVLLWLRGLEPRDAGTGVSLARETLRDARATGPSGGCPTLGQQRRRRWRRAEWIWNA